MMERIRQNRDGTIRWLVLVSAVTSASYVVSIFAIVFDPITVTVIATAIGLVPGYHMDVILDNYVTLSQQMGK
ncbi:MAG: hypothetical protein ACTSVM_05970, partial [Candidatus Ranarchaeia archaeon]